MDIGVLLSETTMLPMRSVGSGENESSRLVLNLKQKALFVYFQLPIFTPGYKPTPASGMLQEYRLKIPFVQLSWIFQVRDTVTGDISHFIVLDSPPLYHRRINNIDVTHSEENNTWRESETWYRQTYIVRNALELPYLPIGLKKAKAVIDIGECLPLRLLHRTSVD